MAFGGGADVTGNENRVVRLNGLFKEIYADNLENLLPKGLKLQKDIPFLEKSKSPGGQYNQPVLTKHEHGFTYANSSSGAFTLAGAVPGETANAQVLGTQMMLRSVIDYEVAARASSGGKRAFRRALDIVVENMFASTRKRMEIDYFYGRRPLVEIDSSVDAGATCTITSTERGWAPGIWAGMEGAKLAHFNNAAEADDGTAIDNVQTTPHLSNTILGVDLNEVNVANKTLQVSGADTHGALDHNTATGESEWVTFDGAMGTTGGNATAEGNVFAGMEDIMNPQGSSLFGIPTASNSLWQGNVKSVTTGGAGARVQKRLGFADVANEIATASAKGLDENLVLYLNPLIWTDLIIQEEANVTYDRQHSGYTIGADSVQFRTANGVVEIKPSNYVKIGHGFMFAPKLWKRIGATDLTFRLPDRGDEFFLHLPDNAGYELRNYVSHCLFTKAPAKSILFTDIKTA